MAIFPGVLVFVLHPKTVGPEMEFDDHHPVLAASPSFGVDQAFEGNAGGQFTCRIWNNIPDYVLTAFLWKCTEMFQCLIVEFAVDADNC